MQDPVGASRRTTGSSAASGLLLLAVLGAGSLTAQARHATEWPTHGGDYSNQRYSPLTQITTRNVGRLVLREMVQTGTERLNGLLTTPIVDGGVMYLTTPFNQLLAWDLHEHRLRWRYEHKLGNYIPCCGPTNRGAAVGHGLVYMATLDAQVVAVDAVSGQLRWSVQDSDPDSAYSFTLAPLVVGDLVIVGTSGAEYATRGRITAYDARTGERRWRWYTIPSPEEGGWWGKWSPTSPWGDTLPRDLAREHADSARYGEAWKLGGGSVWTTPAYDPQSGLLYFAIGNPTPEYDADARPGDNLYTVSLVALEATTGRLRWFHQYLPHDEWDFDAANPPVLFRQKERALLAHAGKTGWVYIVDATTGAPVRRSEPFSTQENLFVRPTPEGVRRAPGAAGGADWHPSAYSPPLGLFFVPASHFPMRFRHFDQSAEAGKDYRGGTEEEIKDEPTWNTLSAVDLATGKIRWEHRDAPPVSSAGGALATAGNLVFSGDGQGWFHAYDARDGRELWRFFCGAGINAPSISFTVNGQQFVAVAAGGSFYSGNLGAAILIFGLPRHLPTKQ